MVWAPVMARWATLTEVRTQWSIDDLADANELLAIKAEATAHAMAQAKQGGSR